MEAGGALTYFWDGKFGSMIIEVKTGLAYVNGKVVEPAVPVETAPPLI